MTFYNGFLLFCLLLFDWFFSYTVTCFHSTCPRQWTNCCLNFSKYEKDNYFFHSENFVFFLPLFVRLSILLRVLLYLLLLVYNFLFFSFLFLPTFLLLCVAFLRVKMLFFVCNLRRKISRRPPSSWVNISKALKWVTNHHLKGVKWVVAFLWERHTRGTVVRPIKWCFVECGKVLSYALIHVSDAKQSNEIMFTTHAHTRTLSSEPMA